jgi:hypothetical protein
MDKFWISTGRRRGVGSFWPATSNLREGYPVVFSSGLKRPEVMPASFMPVLPPALERHRKGD